jgi:hypothetical protein
MMKIHTFLVTGFALIVASAAAMKPWAAAGDVNNRAAQGVPLPAGQFSVTIQGSVADCVNPSNFASEACSTSGVLVLPSSFLTNGSVTHDSAGNTCGVIEVVESLLPLAPSSPFNTSPPAVLPIQHVAETLVDYDSATGIGHRSLTVYFGGTCNGASFNSSGATQNATFISQFVVTKGGNRIDSLDTQIITNPANATGSFLTSGTELRQTMQNTQ